MPEQIRDGTGKGFLAKVDVNNRLRVDSKSSVAEEVAAQNERAFILHGECHLAAAASGGLLAFTSTSVDKLVAISRIYIDAHVLSDNIIVTQVKNPTISSGTDISETGIVNKNYTSRQELLGTLKISDSSADLTYTGGEQYHAFPAPSMTSQQRDMKGTNILGQNDTIVFGWKTADGSNAVDGEVIALSINIYEIPIEEVT